MLYHILNDFKRIKLVSDNNFQFVALQFAGTHRRNWWNWRVKSKAEDYEMLWTGVKLYSSMIKSGWFWIKLDDLKVLNWTVCKSGRSYNIKAKVQDCPFQSLWTLHFWPDSNWQGWTIVPKKSSRSSKNELWIQISFLSLCKIDFWDFLDFEFLKGKNNWPWKLFGCLFHTDYFILARPDVSRLYSCSFVIQ